MKQCILLTHAFVEEHEDYKLDQINFVAKHFRKNNPDAYIIATGHGKKPNQLENYCDYVYWLDDILRSEIGYGHPVLVNVGINHAIQNGFSHILKTRIDGIHMIPNIFDWCLNELGDKKYLTTQITSKDEMILCDLFNFSEVNFMKKCWDQTIWNPSKSGLFFHAKNFFNACKEDTWIDSLKNNCVIKDIYNLKWIDFRSNWNVLNGKTEEMLDNKLDNYIDYLWGSTEGWIVWDSDGNLIRSNTWNIGSLLTEK